MTEQKDLKPPYASTGQADKLLDLFRRVTPQKIDSQFIATNEIATKVNAASVVKLAEWFGLIDENGVVKLEKINKLKLVGEARNTYIVELIRASYKDLFDRVNIETATRDDVVNYFVHTYTYGNTAAQQAAILFLHLCQTYGIPISEGLKKKAYTAPPQPRAKTARASTKSGIGASAAVEAGEPAQAERKGSGIEITIRGFGLETNQQNSIIARTPEELDEVLRTEFDALMKYSKILLKKAKTSIQGGNNP